VKKTKKKAKAKKSTPKKAKKPVAKKPREAKSEQAAPQETNVVQEVPASIEKPRAYTVVIESDGYRLGIAVEGEAGYHKVKDDSDAGGTFSSREEAKATADAYNEGLGLTKERSHEIVSSSMGAQNAEDDGDDVESDNGDESDETDDDESDAETAGAEASN
jgi:hypothetical protein